MCENRHNFIIRPLEDAAWTVVLTNLLCGINAGLCLQDVSGRQAAYMQLLDRVAAPFNFRELTFLAAPGLRSASGRCNFCRRKRSLYLLFLSLVQYKGRIL